MWFVSEVNAMFGVEELTSDVKSHFIEDMRSNGNILMNGVNENVLKID